MCIVKETDVISLWLALAQPYEGIKKMAKTKADRTRRQGRLTSGDDHAEGQKKRLKEKDELSLERQAGMHASM